MAALQAAAEMARWLDAELLGIFVEDIDLVRLAGLPIARRFGYYTTSQHSLDLAGIEQELRAQANQARRALAAAAQRAHLRASFRVTRGAIAAELIQASNEVDLIILGKSGWSRRRRIGSTTRMVIAQSSRHILVLQQTFTTQPLLGVMVADSPGLDKTLEVAVNLLSGREGFLTAIIMAGEIEAARQLQVEVAQWLKSRGVQARYRWLVGIERSRLAALVRSEGLGALVLPASSGTLTGETLELFLEQTDIPVLLVR
jgi:nucleotide-binding universal stress UspA family protein